MDDKKEYTIEDWLTLSIVGLVLLIVLWLPILIGFILFMILYFIESIKYYHAIGMAVVTFLIMTILYRGIIWVTQYFTIQISTVNAAYHHLGDINWLQFTKYLLPFSLFGGFLVAAALLWWIEKEKSDNHVKIKGKELEPHVLHFDLEKSQLTLYKRTEYEAIVKK